jgi:hypothetical protein
MLWDRNGIRKNTPVQLPGLLHSPSLTLNLPIPLSLAAHSQVDSNVTGLLNSMFPKGAFSVTDVFTLSFRDWPRFWLCMSVATTLNFGDIQLEKEEREAGEFQLLEV